MDPYYITKINKQYDDQIDYLLKLIEMQSKTIIKLQKQRTDEIKELLTVSVCYDSACCVNTAKCSDRLFNNANFDDKLFDVLHQYNELYRTKSFDPCDKISNSTLHKQMAKELHQTESFKLCDKISNSSLDKQMNTIDTCGDNLDMVLSNQELISNDDIQLDKQLLEKQINTSDPYGDNLDMGLSDQDLIWERIRNSQIEIEQKQLDKQHETKSKPPSITENINEDDDEEDNPHIIFKSNNLAHDLEMVQIKEPDNTPPRINALYKVNPTSRKAIIRDIFKEATGSIKKLSELDGNYKDNFDNEVQKEADRLLEVYLKTH
jgi:hypothetical protein